MIIPITRDAFPSGTSHTFGYLNSEQELVFSQSADKAYSRAAGVPARVGQLDPSETRNLQKQTLNFNGNTIDTYVPAQNMSISSGNFKPGFFLLLDQYRFSKQAATVEGSGYAGHEQQAVYNLIFQTNYVYWNPSTGETAGWGSARASVSIEGSVATREDLADALSRTLEDIARQGPARGNP
ncbi:MAG: hypothetical protein U5K31_13515 [Balneolaceae bacterium]|nr:hypothetical protein [Balneolaceae bacterium]